MTRVVPSFKKSSADQWLKPRAILSKRARDLGYVFDRPPVLLSPGNQRIFLFEGGKPKEGLSPNPLSMLEKGGSWLADLFEGPADAKDGKSAFRKSKEKTLRKALEKKLEGDPKDGTPGKFDTLFLGEYPTWCHGLSDDACWCCEEAHAEKDKGQETTAAPLLWLLAALALIAFLTYLFLRASCAIFGGSACALIGVPEPLPSFEPPQPTETAPPAAPLAPPATPPKVEQPATPYPGLSQKPTVPPPAAVPPKIELPKPRIFHVAFFEAKANLTPEAMSALSSAAAQSVQMNKTVTLRVFALGGRETDDELWRRRLYAVKDELVRLGVPANRIRWEGAGPFNVVIRSKQQLRPQGKKRQTYDLDSVDDPLSPD
jgi:outer membrane protein OmpA-like peptidoglycan-associated protein